MAPLCSLGLWLIFFVGVSLFTIGPGMCLEGRRSRSFRAQHCVE